MSLSTRSARQHPVIWHRVEERSDGLCRLFGRDFYRICSYDRLSPFLMSIVSDTDLWMYVSSSGGLTAGRCDEDHALFPYETDDRLHRASHTTGPFTLLRVAVPGKDPVLWQPFSDALVRPRTQRTLYKSVLGNQLIFEESHVDLGLRFRYRWRNAGALGFIRTCSIESNRDAAASIDVLDGLLNILPAGVDLVTHQRASCLVNAYSQSEVDRETGLATYSMSSLIVDKAEAADSLRANLVWSCGLDNPKVLISNRQIAAFAAGHEVVGEQGARGVRGAYLVSSQVTVSRDREVRWDVIADSARDHFAVENIQARIRHESDLTGAIEKCAAEADDNLMRNLASADGLQLTADRLACQHHLANVLFNNMRGGVFVDNGTVSAVDLKRNLAERNREVSDATTGFFDRQPEHQPIDAWLKAAETEKSPSLTRLIYEYLPITFSRRHGDPSRPWNRFKIAVQDRDGNPILNYQGNWRDIFQNWEALLTSFPGYIESVIAKFLNASTMDGFNPYRITRQGVEWEKPDPHDPWANIGYWGDHQIVYLLRLLELSHRYHGNLLSDMLDQRIFACANVPYRLKPFDELVVDRSNTIQFDQALDQAIETRLALSGSDARLVADPEGRVLHVTLLEKLIIPLLSKLSNLVIDGGIWMNTQRPEWNDANNALVGNGISMVTLCHLRRYIHVVQQIVSESKHNAVAISLEVAQWAREVTRILMQNQSLLTGPPPTDQARWSLLQQLGIAFSEYRKKIYSHALSDPVPVDVHEISQLLSIAMLFSDHAIAVNRRADGLFHAYNVGRFEPQNQTLSLARLPLMLEGQVAALSSGALSSREAVTLIEKLFDSPLYRLDQSSFMLYPDRQLPLFADRNIIPYELMQTNPLMMKLIEQNETTVVTRDAKGQCRFCGSPSNATDVGRALDHLSQAGEWSSLVDRHRQGVLDIYESVVNHHAFTGRSGAMYGYEGLGCIYWHMVSKLLLAVQEVFWKACDSGDDVARADQLAILYYKVRKGLSFNKSADEYGAIPLDPYSHTPGHAGAQQPGMTGQVKEEILTRAGELGMRIDKGSVSFATDLLKATELLPAPATWEYVDLASQMRKLSLAAGSLAFTLCQVPIRLSRGNQGCIVIHYRDGEIKTIEGATLPVEVSQSIFSRTGQVHWLDVTVTENPGAAH